MVRFFCPLKGFFHLFVYFFSPPVGQGSQSGSHCPKEGAVCKSVVQVFPGGKSNEIKK